jgi:hypothetical protein
MNIDVFILTNTLNKEYFNITEKAILTLKESEGIAKFNIFLIESNINSNFDNLYVDMGCNFVTFNDNFSFSKAMNYAIRHGKNKYALITNNDVIFTKNWFDEIYEYLNLKNVVVWSTYDPNLNFNIQNSSDVIEGYKPVGVHSGWCYLIDTERLGDQKFLSEEYDIWFMDDDLCMRIQNLHLKQILCKKSKVYHIGQSSHKNIEEFKKRTEVDKSKFIRKYENQIRIHNIQFLENQTVINFEGFSNKEYKFKITSNGNLLFQDNINILIGHYYYISVSKCDNLILNVENSEYSFVSHFEKM